MAHAVACGASAVARAESGAAAVTPHRQPPCAHPARPRVTSFCSCATDPNTAGCCKRRRGESRDARTPPSGAPTLTSTRPQRPSRLVAGTPQGARRSAPRWRPRKRAGARLHFRTAAAPPCGLARAAARHALPRGGPLSSGRPTSPPAHRSRRPATPAAPAPLPRPQVPRLQLRVAGGRELPVLPGGHAAHRPVLVGHHAAEERPRHGGCVARAGPRRARAGRPHRRSPPSWHPPPLCTPSHPSPPLPRAPRRTHNALLLQHCPRAAWSRWSWWACS